MVGDKIALSWQIFLLCGWHRLPALGEKQCRPSSTSLLLGRHNCVLRVALQCCVSGRTVRDEWHSIAIGAAHGCYV